MIKLFGRATIPALSLGAALGMFVSPAMAMSYSPPSSSGYQLTLGGTYLSESGQTSGGGCVGTAGSGGTCPYIPADFAHSEVENGSGTTYIFYFTVGIGSTDYLNVSAPSTGTLEGFDVTTYTYVGSPAPGTLVSGPLLINDSTGISLAFTAGAGFENYYVEITLYCGDLSSCTAGKDIDPTNNISDTSTADYTVVSGTPLPGTLPLFASGLGVLGFLARRIRKSAPAARAT